MRLFVVCCCLAIVGEPDTLKEFKLDDGKFKILLPAAPDITTQKMPNNSLLRLYVAKGNAGTYQVATTEVPEAVNEPEDKLQARLDAARDQGVQNAKGKLIKETRIKLANKYVGRELLVEVPADKLWLRNRTYFAEGRMYQVMVSGEADFVQAPLSGKFLDSLVVTSK